MPSLMTHSYQCRASGVQIRAASNSTACCSSTNFRVRSSSARRFNVRCSYTTQTREVQSALEATYSGVYGPWKLTKEDVLEVYGYRAGLGAAACGMLFGTAGALSPADSFLHQIVAANLNAACVVGASGLGLSLWLVHMYLGSIKKTIQALYTAGVLGGTYIMLTQDTALPLYVAEHREAVWLVGPFFAALTGLSIKEGLCYGKAEATVVAATLPLLLLGHLSGVLDGGPEKGLLCCATAGLAVLAGRKWTQPIKDDVGDKSVFVFQSLPEEEQIAILNKKREGEL